MSGGYLARLDLLPELEALVRESPGMSVRALARRFDVHPACMKGTLGDQFMLFHGGRAIHVFPLDLAGDPLATALLLEPWVGELLAAWPAQTKELVALLGVPRSTLKHRVSRLRRAGLID